MTTTQPRQILPRSILYRRARIRVDGIDGGGITTSWDLAAHDYCSLRDSLPEYAARLSVKKRLAVKGIAGAGDPGPAAHQWCGLQIRDAYTQGKT